MAHSGAPTPGSGRPAVPASRSEQRVAWTDFQAAVSRCPCLHGTGPERLPARVFLGADSVPPARLHWSGWPRCTPPRSGTGKLSESAPGGLGEEHRGAPDCAMLRRIPPACSAGGSSTRRLPGTEDFSRSRPPAGLDGCKPTVKSGQTGIEVISPPSEDEADHPACARWRLRTCRSPTRCARLAVGGGIRLRRIGNVSWRWNPTAALSPNTTAGPPHRHHAHLRPRAGLDRHGPGASRGETSRAGHPPCSTAACAICGTSG